MTHFLSVSGRLMKFVLFICALWLLPFSALGQPPKVEQILKGSDAGPQVKVHLRVLEVSQTKLKRLGFDMSKLQAEPNAKPGVVEKNDNLFSKFEVIEENGKTNGILEALCKDNLAKVLVNSNLAPPSGKTVVYNFDKDPQDAKAAKDGRSAQVRLKAEILAEQHVRLELLYRGTQPAPAQTGVIVKKTSPGVQESTFMAKADLRSGQILILPGPLQIRMEAHNEGVPLISDIPYVGALFRKVKEDRNEVQLLVLVQPEIMPPRAAAAGHRPAESNVQR